MLIFLRMSWRQRLGGLACSYRVIHEHKGERDVSEGFFFPDLTPGPHAILPIELVCFEIRFQSYFVASSHLLLSLTQLIYLRHHYRLMVLTWLQRVFPLWLD